MKIIKKKENDDIYPAVMVGENLNLHRNQDLANLANGVRKS